MASERPTQIDDHSAPHGADLAVARPEARQPPTIAGYVLHTLLGRGAYGEVWLGENRTTKRQVAVKFLHSRATLDWWLLDGETEKLAFLAADRRVVQLLDVGRDAHPPFFVMEYVARGSLAGHLERVGPLPVERTVATFEEIALGLMQVHAKGILHCDLKPSNILLDDELRPRLADFGQSRLAEDRSPTLALGTMFFMAPEQADPAAVPDARWDVFALGAVLYTMLEGQPPHQSEEALSALRSEPDLPRRLARYRQVVTASAAARRPQPRRKIDGALAQILTRCLAIDPRERFSTVQEVVEALRQRREARSRRPILLLGGVGPVLLLAVMTVFGVRGYQQATRQSADAIRRRAFESNKFAAAFIARSLEVEARQYFDVVSDEAASPAFQAAYRKVIALPHLTRLAEMGTEREEEAVKQFLDHPDRRALDQHFRQRLDHHLAQWRGDPKAPRFVSIFAVDARGTHLGAAYDPDQITRSTGRYFAWRTYFHGGSRDLPRATPLAQIEPIDRLHLSAPYRSTTTKAWRVGISVPLYAPGPDASSGGAGGQRVFVGVLVISVDIGNFDFLAASNQPAHDRFAVLADARGSDGPARITLHPYFGEVAPIDTNDSSGPAIDPVIDRQVLAGLMRDWRQPYLDPLGKAPGGQAYRGPWIAAAQPIQLLGGAQGPGDLMVLVQERSGAATAPVEQLGSRLVAEGILALLAIGFTLAALWYFALRGRWPRPERAEDHPPPADGPTPLRERSTLSETGGPGG